jgi:hypothetical protein
MRFRGKGFPMTSIIGMLSDADPIKTTGTLLLSADELISYGTVSSNRNGSKIFDLPEGFYGAIADDISRCHQVISFLHHRMNVLGVKKGQPNSVDLVKKALADSGDYVRAWIRREICAEYGVSEDEFLHDPMLSERDQIRENLRSAALETQIIIIGFGPRNSPVLFFMDGINVQEQTNPGFFCGGSGSTAALNWLNFRGQNSFMGIQRSYYHLREAQAFAQLSRFVGNTTVTIMLTPEAPCVTIDAPKDDQFLQTWRDQFFCKDSALLDSAEARSIFSRCVDCVLPTYVPNKKF